MGPSKPETISPMQPAATKGPDGANGTACPVVSRQERQPNVPDTSVRVLPVVPDEATRMQLSEFIQSTPGLELVSAHGDAKGALSQGLRKPAPDVALVDAVLPDLTGFECARSFKAIAPHVRVLIHVDRLLQSTPLLCLNSGACGWVVNGGHPDTIRSVLCEAGADRAPLPSSTLAWIRNFAQASFGGEQASKPLTNREREIALLLASGRHPKDISVNLGLALGTVRAHQANLYRKLRVHRQHDLTKALFGIQ